MKKSPATIKFEKFLESINGLESGYKKHLKITDRYFFEVEDGWLPLLEELITNAIALGWNKQVRQVKEKFGGLRFYVGPCSDEVIDLIEEAGRKSYTICENCGKSGKLRKTVVGNWFFTNCDSCAANRTNFYGEKIKSEIVKIK